jgi:hypothetical protein
LFGVPDVESTVEACTLLDYDPSTGRFASRDPIDYAGGMNLYGYCGGDPVNEADPEGTDEIIIYGGDSKGKDQYFLDAAKALRQQYDVHHPGQKAYIFNAKGMLGNSIHGPTVWKYALTHVESITAITYVGHAGITLDDGEYVSKLYSGWTIADDVTVRDVGAFPTHNVAPHPRIFLFGCSTAATKDNENGNELSPGQESISQAFANHFHTDVQGFNRHVGFGRNIIDYVYKDYDLYHDTQEEIYPVTVSPN